MYLYSIYVYRYVCVYPCIYASTLSMYIYLIINMNVLCVFVYMFYVLYICM